MERREEPVTLKALNALFIVLTFFFTLWDLSNGMLACIISGPYFMTFSIINLVFSLLNHEGKLNFLKCRILWYVAAFLNLPFVICAFIFGVE